MWTRVYAKMGGGVRKFMKNTENLRKIGPRPLGPESAEKVKKSAPKASIFAKTRIIKEPGPGDPENVEKSAKNP